MGKQRSSNIYHRFKRILPKMLVLGPQGVDLKVFFFPLQYENGRSSFYNSFKPSRDFKPHLFLYLLTTIIFDW